MLLTSLLGTFVALQEDLISIQQAESYWLSDFTAELFEEMKLSQEVIVIIQEGITLKDLQPFSSLYHNKLDELIQSSKELIFRYYTDYHDLVTRDEDDDDDYEIEVESVIN